MNVYVTRWVVSGRIELVDLALDDTGKYWCGDSNGTHYFISKKDACLTKEDAKKNIADKFRKRRESLQRQLSDLDKVEQSVIWSIDHTP